MKTTPLAGGVRDQELTAYASAVGAYVIWGFLPLYFMFLGAIPADQVVAQRIIWSVVLVGIAMLAARRFDEVMEVFRDRKRVMRLTLSAAILAGNWLIFILAVEHSRVLEVSFGYFINPLVSVGLGTILLGERLSRGQMLAVGIASVAIAIQAWGLGSFPWVSLALAFTFGIYGFLRKKVVVGAAPGLFVEAAVLVPLALAYLAWNGLQGTLTFGGDALGAVLVAGTGVVTAVPLILFARGVSVLPLTTIGILQYFAPSLHFILAIVVFDEPLDPMRLASFALIWVSLVVFTRDLLRRRAAAVAAGKAAAAAAAAAGTGIVK